MKTVTRRVVHTLGAGHIYAVVQNDETGEEQLIAFDRNGKELWRKREALNYTINIACADDGTLFSVESRGIKKDKTWWARFYDKDGKVVNEVKLEGEKDCWYGSAAVSQDGKVAAYVHRISRLMGEPKEPDDHLFFFNRDNPKVVAMLSGFGAEKKQGWRISITPNGKYLLADVFNRPENPMATSIKESRVVLYNIQGQEVWGHKIEGGTKPKFGGNHYLFFPANYGPVFKLFKIED